MRIIFMVCVVSQLKLQLAGMTEYSVMEDKDLTKIEYVLILLFLSFLVS